MWQVWHKAVAVNVWREVISSNIDKHCVCCDSNQGVYLALVLGLSDYYSLLVICQQPHLASWCGAHDQRRSDLGSGYLRG